MKQPIKMQENRSPLDTFEHFFFTQVGAVV